VNEAHDKAMKMQEENMKLNAQNAQQTEMMKFDNELKKIKAQEESDIRVEAAKAVLSMQTIKDTALLELQKELIMSTLMPQQQGQPQGEQVGLPPMQ
jgi:hypothetical protein